MLYVVVEVYMWYNGIKLVLVNGESILVFIVEGLRCGIKLYFEIKVFSVGLNFYKIVVLEGFFGEVLVYYSLINSFYVFDMKVKFM